MKLYFYNSYQSSPMGFQLTEFDRESGKTLLTGFDDAISEEVKSLLTNSGAICAAGNAYFVFKNISVTDADNVPWSVNFAFVSDEGSDEEFKNVFHNILTDYSSFKKALGSWFSASYDGELSYCVVPDALEEYIHFSQNDAFETSEFFKSGSASIAKYKNAIQNIENKSFVVYETTENYFYEQNPVFKNNKFSVVFDFREFKYLLMKDEELLRAYEYKKAEEAAQQSDSKKFFDNDAVKTAAKVAGGVAAVATLAYLAKKIFFRR